MKVIMKVNNISKSYINGGIKNDVLTNINLDIMEGELTAILGRSGSGKTTLLNIMGGIDIPDKGEVFLGDKEIFCLSEKENTLLRRKEIGFVFQSYQLISVLNVFENIILPQIDNDKRYAEKILEILQISDKRLNYPNELSGGQQQRAAIARALINHPKIVLADEPTRNLDSKTEKVVTSMFHELIKEFGTTIVLITHNEDLASTAKKIVRIQDGILI